MPSKEKKAIEEAQRKEREREKDLIMQEIILGYLRKRLKLSLTLKIMIRTLLKGKLKS